MLVNDEISHHDQTSSTQSPFVRRVAQREEVVRELSQQLGRNYAAYAQVSQAILAQQQTMPLTDFKALEFLLSFGSLPTGQLAQLTGLSHGGIATLISRLENAGLVTRDRHPEDRRIVAICADHEQCAGLSFPMDQMEEAIAGIAERYSSRELSIVSSFLEDCAKLLHTFNMQQLETASQATAASS
ncbi:MarR family winged helix-turn-helix transcriptional regulator [Paracandidimonas soli]|uniref:DNA-binding MarR family transcriptional regulator n=1 Tax=Paracandidimonas soli TaxID=1917182 RepID=A0A4R3V6E6_9BURK|nr:helix-turn-helix domain-containing protein [Paracandidimonas soli]TCV00617.1 DNA-binding MarR family transcriptional regulator [Paracandidimonas soli]